MKLPVLILTVLMLFSNGFGQLPAGNKVVVGILIFDNVQIIDYTGPYEVFTAVGYNVVTIAPEKKMITTVGNMKVMPDFDFNDAPKLDVLLVPGGGVRGTNNLQGVWQNAPLPIKENPETIKWIQAKSAEARFVFSVCNGAFTLARAGLLENQSATTTVPFLNKLKEVSPTTKVVSNMRWADSGKFISSGGLTAGIDASFYLIEKISGLGTAQQVALGMEYNWDRSGRYAPANLARKYTAFVFPGINAESTLREGNEEFWENRWLVSKPANAGEILDLMNKTLVENTTFGLVTVKWERQKTANTKPNSSLWNFADENGRKWVGLVTIEPSTTEKERFVLSLKVALKDSAFARSLK